MNNRKEDEVNLPEEEIDRLLLETLDDSSRVYMNTNEQENVDEFLNLSELEEIERIKKKKEEQEEIERIKKEKEEREEFDRLLNEIVKDSYPVYTIKKEPVEFDLPMFGMTNNSFPEYNIKTEPVEFDLPLNEMSNDSFPEYNIKKEPLEFDLPLNEILNDLPPKRKRSVTVNPDLSPPRPDPLQIAAEMIIKYHDFVDYTIDLLSEERGDEEMEAQKWSRILKRGNQLIESVNPRMKRIGREMDRMKKDGNLRKEHAFRKNHIDEMMKQLRDINAGIEGSVDFSRVSDMRYTERVLPKCLKLLRSSKEELSVLIQVIEELKVINKDDDDGQILHSETDES